MMLSLTDAWKSCGPQHFEEGPSPGDGPEDLGQWAACYHDQIVDGEKSLSPLYWRLGRTLELARKHFGYGQWERFLAAWKIDKTRGAKARAIYKAFPTEASLRDLSVEDAYAQRKQNAGAGKRAGGRRNTTDVGLHDFLNDICIKAEQLIDEDEAKTGALVKELSAERSVIVQELQTLEKVRRTGIKVPSADEVRAFIRSLHDVLIKAGTSCNPADVEAVRNVIVLVTGGRIVVEQMGEKEPRRGWLRGKFRLRLLDVVAQHFAGCTVQHDDEGVEVTIDFKPPEPSADRVQRAFELHFYEGKSNKEIEEELGLWRSQVTQFVQRGYKANGMDKPDGRKYKRMNKTAEFKRIADDVLVMVNDGKLIAEIVEATGYSRTTIDDTIDYLRNERGIEIPDGRTRRKSLTRKRRHYRRGSNKQ